MKKMLIRSGILLLSLTIFLAFDDEKTKVDIENISGYTNMDHYVRFRIESFFSNERMLSAFEKMPEDYYKMKSFEKMSVTLNEESINAG